ncbi:MAG TPA: hypothetical protein VGS22_06080 [Thermoanaerobaculia bacterium]|jgi:hypothetical protein|nr:hypothetical protein [Thermoanaerobaculia bacterium]
MPAVPIAFPSYLMPVDPASVGQDRPLLPEPLPAFLMRLLTQVETLRGAARVALLHPNGEELAALLIHNGKICYVERSLAGAEATELLAREDPEVLALIGRLTHDAQGRFTTLSSLLKAAPDAPFERVREFLLAHTVRGILGLAWAAAGAPIALRPTAHYSGSFDPDLSFFPLEVYLRAVQTLDLAPRHPPAPDPSDPPSDLAAALFDEVADQFDLGLILEQEADDAFYLLALRAPEDAGRTLRLTGISNQLAALASDSGLDRVEFGWLRIVTYESPDGCWLMVPGRRRRVWLHLAGDDARARALLKIAPRLAAAR